MFALSRKAERTEKGSLLHIWGNEVWGNLERLKENPSGPSSWIMFGFSYLDFVASKFYSLERCIKDETYHLNQTIFSSNILIGS